MSRRLWIVVALAVVAGLAVWRGKKVSEVLVSAGETTFAIDVSEADIALARRLPVSWDSSESGAPAVFDPSEKLLADVETAVFRRAMVAAEVLLDEGELPQGRYEFDDPLRDAGAELEPYVAHGLAEVRGGRVAIDVTEAHLKLMKRANVRQHDDGGRRVFVGIDSKRPYGDMTDFYIDMGDILGIAPQGPPREDRPDLREFSDEQAKAFDRLHEQMQPVMQAFLQHATLAPGRFVRVPAGYGKWRRAW